MPNWSRSRAGRVGKQSALAPRVSKRTDLTDPTDLRPIDLPPTDYNPTPEISNTALITELSPFFLHSSVIETEETHLIPRQSLGEKLNLYLLPQRFETEQLFWRQLDHRTGQMVTGSNTRVTWKSDRTLLYQDKPEKEIGAPMGKGLYGFKRESAVVRGLNKRKFTRIEPEISPDVAYEDKSNPLPPDTFEE